MRLTQRSCYPRPLTADNSGSFEAFTSSQLAHEDELEAQRNEIEKDNAFIERAERKRDDEDGDYGLGSQELYQQISSQSTESTDSNEEPSTPVRGRYAVREVEFEEPVEEFSSSQSSNRSDGNSYRSREEMLHADKDITSKKILLIDLVLNRSPMDVPSPARRTCAKNIIAVLYGLEHTEIDLIELWIRQHADRLHMWPYGEH
ncbi:hypothetical protein BJ138DRAFT_1111850 [Hygrophoropsis aurantiaca]|uniref:Uncharacterized protein n=1 Tax=Hygrophoropsis aurantiaca TaxID=72124 RepID=A0ACB8AJ56_9AGAM|nr:hypothetical protein BJ138DRAFT_1111850 [Hygrophoropsis aurantiaca]